jgi:hypothetical protein
MIKMVSYHATLDGRFFNMAEKEELEIVQPDHPEIEQKNLPEFGQSTKTHQDDNTNVLSEEMRFKNADSMYRSARDHDVDQKEHE